MADKIKLSLAVLMVFAGIVGYYQFADRLPMVVRVLMVVAGLGVGAVVAWLSQPGKEFLVFAQESFAEGKRVSWPTRKEAMQTTGIVFVFVFLMALFLWGVDASLMALAKLLLGRGD